jgi:uncharacterized membrane protein YvbJ
VICRQCGTEIAAKALICYRCGTATTEAKYKPPAPKRSTTPLIVSVLALVVLLIVAVYLGRTPIGDVPRFATWIAVGVAVLVVALRAYARRR